jgi:hypothetical protein
MQWGSESGCTLSNRFVGVLSLALLGRFVSYLKFHNREIFQLEHAAIGKEIEKALEKYLD